jgi:hypothetical protein
MSLGVVCDRSAGGVACLLLQGRRAVVECCGLEFGGCFMWPLSSRGLC